MAKSAKPRKRTPSTQAKSKPNKLDAAVRGSFSLNILRLAEYSTMNVLNGNIIKDKVHARRYFKTLEVPQKWGITYGVLYRINGEWGITHNFVRFKDKCRFEHLDQELDYYLGEAIKKGLRPFYLTTALHNITFKENQNANNIYLIYHFVNCFLYRSLFFYDPNRKMVRRFL